MIQTVQEHSYAIALEVSARDLVHLAVMRRLGVSRIVTTDTDFDGLAEVEVLDLSAIRGDVKDD